MKKRKDNILSLVKASEKRQKNTVTDDKETSPELAKEMEDLGVTEFTKEHKKLRKLIKRSDFNPDSVSIALSKTLLAMTLQMLPRIEEYFHKSQGKGVYGVIALSSQIRELATDLRALSDKVNLTDRIIQEVIEANLAIAAQAIASEFNTLGRAIYETSDSKRAKTLMAKLERHRETAINRLLETRMTMRDKLTKIIEG